MTSVAASFLTWWNWSIVIAVSSWRVLYRFLSVMLNSSLIPWSLSLVRSNHFLVLVTFLTSRILRRILQQCTTKLHAQHQHNYVRSRRCYTPWYCLWDVIIEKKIPTKQMGSEAAVKAKEVHVIVQKLMKDNIKRRKLYDDRKLNWKSFNKVNNGNVTQVVLLSG